MNQQFNEGKFNYSDLLNMPNVSMIDLGSFQNPVQQPKKEKKKPSITSVSLLDLTIID